MTTTKAQRREAIVRLVRERTIHSQEELQQELAAIRIRVTQATLSRDLRDLGMFKGPDGYVLREVAAGTPPAEEVLRRSLRRELRWIDYSANIVLLRTDAGHANALAVEIDRARLPEVLGTLAGDDTIFVIVKRAQSSNRFVKRLQAMASAA